MINVYLQSVQFLRVHFYLSSWSISAIPMLVDCSPILSSTASMQFECSDATGNTSRAVHVTSRFGVGAAAAATSLLTAEL